MFMRVRTRLSFLLTIVFIASSLLPLTTSAAPAPETPAVSSNPDQVGAMHTLSEYVPHTGFCFEERIPDGWGLIRWVDVTQCKDNPPTGRDVLYMFKYLHKDQTHWICKADSLENYKVPPDGWTVVETRRADRSYSCPDKMRYLVEYTGDDSGGPGGPGDKEGLRETNSKAISREVSVPIRVVGIDVPFTNRRVLHTQIRLTLSEPAAGHVRMRGKFEAVQPRDNWQVVDESESITCSEYPEGNDVGVIVNRARCVMEMNIIKQGNWELDMDILENKGTPKVSINRSQNDSVLTVQWIFTAQLSERNGIRGYSVYEPFEGDSPLFFLSGE